MSERSGPYRIVALHCGKFDYAEVEIDAPVHLIGPNNVGKTSLIALLQFLYLDDQRQMQFSRDMAETRRYYFPGKYSYALFECLTPTGLQVVGVHGLGPVRQYDFERFACAGRIDLTDYLDDQRRVREPEDTFSRLAVKGFKRLEPRHLRAALTGVGDGRDVHLGLVPTRHTGAYERFRKVFGNLLRLAHIRQDELKQLLLDLFANEFHQREIDLARHYAAGFAQVRRDSHEVQELKLLQADIERLLRHLQHRDRARHVLPALWQAIGEAFTTRRATLDRKEAALAETRQRIESEQAALRADVDADQSELREIAGKSAVLTQQLERLDRQRRRFEAFVPAWAEQRRRTVRASLEDLVVQLRRAEEAPAEQCRERLRLAQEELVAKRRQLENLSQAVIQHLRTRLREEEIADAFSILHPDLLALPVNTEQPGVRIPEDQAAAEAVRELLTHRTGSTLSLRGVAIDLDALSPPTLARYRDRERIQDDLAALEQDAQRFADALDACRQADSLRADKADLEEEEDRLRRDLQDYEAHCADAAKEEGWKDLRTSLSRREHALKERLAAHEDRRTTLQEAMQETRTQQSETARQRGRLQEEVRSLPVPAEAWPLHPIADVPAEWGELTARYRQAYAEEQRQAEQVAELLDTIEQRTYGRYAADDEAATVQALREQLETIPQREQAVEEMWKSIAVGIKKDLQNIGRDLETLQALVGGLNRRFAAVNISNLASLRLLIEERPRWVKWIREIAVDEELPLFSHPQAAERALEAVSRLLSEHPRVDLRDLFDLSFEIGTPDGASYRHHHLDSIESNGTTVAIKVLVNLVLLRHLLGPAAVQIPFYLDECSSLDQANLTAIVNAARRMDFIAVLASPDAMDAADKLYFIEEQAGGRVVLEPRTALVRIYRAGVSPEDGPDA